MRFRLLRMWPVHVAGQRHGLHGMAWHSMAQRGLGMAWRGIAAPNRMGAMTGLVGLPQTAALSPLPA